MSFIGNLSFIDGTSPLLCLSIPSINIQKTDITKAEHAGLEPKYPYNHSCLKYSLAFIILSLLIPPVICVCAGNSFFMSFTYAKIPYPFRYPALFSNGVLLPDISGYPFQQALHQFSFYIPRNIRPDSVFQ